SQSGRNLGLTETKYFLVYSDLSPRETKATVEMLEKTYERMSKMFGLAAGENIWKGKAMAVIFENDRDYLAFEQEVHQADSRGAIGGSNMFPDGRVRLVFHGQPNEPK